MVAKRRVRGWLSGGVSFFPVPILTPAPYMQGVNEPSKIFLVPRKFFAGPLRSGLFRALECGKKKIQKRRPAGRRYGVQEGGNKDGRIQDGGA